MTSGSHEHGLSVILRRRPQARPRRMNGTVFRGRCPSEARPCKLAIADFPPILQISGKPEIGGQAPESPAGNAANEISAFAAARHARYSGPAIGRPEHMPCAGHPRLHSTNEKDVDDRTKPGHDDGEGLVQLIERTRCISGRTLRVTETDSTRSRSRLWISRIGLAKAGRAAGSPMQPGKSSSMGV